jgi:hypothetical protein
MRLLLCRPEGGLNDILSEIGKCMAYCITFDRVLVVQSNYIDNHHFKDAFSNYFKATNPRFILNAESNAVELDSLSVLPNFMQGRLNTYRREQLWKELPAMKNAGITFDFSKDHSEQLLVHHQNGQHKKRNAMIALSHLQLVDQLALQLEQRLQILGQDYTGFHVRHTDYKTDYEKRVKRLAGSVDGPVFLATDNRAVLEFFKNVFGGKRIFGFSVLPDEAGEPLHHGAESSVLRARNVDAVLDLFTLALAREYHFFPRVTAKFSLLPVYSGFSSLAARLRASPQILKHVLPVDFHGRIIASSGLTQLRWRHF